MIDGILSKESSVVVKLNLECDNACVFHYDFTSKIIFKHGFIVIFGVKLHLILVNRVTLNPIMRAWGALNYSIFSSGCLYWYQSTDEKQGD